MTAADEHRQPVFRPIAEHGVLVEFGDEILLDTNRRVRQLDQAIAAAAIDGVTEAIPAYTSLLVGFDPIVTDHEQVQAAIVELLAHDHAAPGPGRTREVLVCYDDELGPDLDAVADAVGLSREAAIASHLGGRYRVFMYGFAPGYAYLAGVPAALQRPRKPAAVRGIAAGSVIIAGPQCLVTTMIMPTGWWIIGRSPTQIVDDGADEPFLFDVGDEVRFIRIDRAAFDEQMAGR